MKKIFTFVFTLLLTTFTAFAMPGFDSYIKDNSGEFVYYRDYSFPHEAYVGILYYSEDSIQIRYYCPQNNENFIPEKEISILFSINPDAPNMEFTGELIMSTILPESNDVEIVNYLHDILYEFSARRIKENTVTVASSNFIKDNHFMLTGIHSSQSYDQFGGNVTIIFDPLIPIFNIKAILNSDGEQVLSCATFGMLQSSADSTFDSFKGFPAIKRESNPDKKSNIKTNQKAVEYITTKNQTISLDSNWTQAMENLWLCGDEGLLTINYLPPMNIEKDAYDLTILRRLLVSTNSSYTNLDTLDIIRDEKKDTYKINQFSYQPNTDNTILNKRLITRDPDEKGFYYFSLTVFQDFYNLNRSYYDKLQKSYQIKN